ncbi:polysaccharide pyruvyl transferase family protein [Microbulbifer elongatus]|uniref:Polysaccharide pyruvyl transferase family protein n=1 Tax=Microbulbifer elongatus TaxID=86173 RepID=A0ABT1P3D1_9GAMM|nr:polysaccharide pyruvyl transferase family protein [Microbulbifer elongatus]MCQ3830628.1 polysaccharide pyruvyl transferase family protein [Microbulbifer elongatus]
MENKLVPEMFQKIHFVRIIDFNYSNTGDIFSSPLMYTQNFFKNYSVITHNLSSVRYTQISRNDVVIIGGGGLLNYNPWFNFNVAISKIVDLCDNVVLWGAGFNSTYNWKKGTVPDYSPKIDFSRFALYGIRDKDYCGHNFVPCASSMSPLLQKAYDARPSKKLGTILREDEVRDEKRLYLEGVENITHYNNYTTVMDFIADHEYIVTTSYHGALWATLANRKVIVPSGMKGGFKYNFYGFPVKFVDDITDNKQLSKAMGEVQSHPQVLEEFRCRNYEFFEQVKCLVHKVIPIPDKSYEYFYRQNEAAEHYFKLTRNK